MTFHAIKKYGELYPFESLEAAEDAITNPANHLSRYSALATCTAEELAAQDAYLERERRAEAACEARS